MGCSTSRPTPQIRRYVDPEAVFDALDEGGDATLLLRASWLKKQDGAHCRFMKREHLPPEALIGVAELRQIWEARRLHNGKKTALPLLTLSHFWRCAIRLWPVEGAPHACTERLPSPISFSQHGDAPRS